MIYPQHPHTIIVIPTKNVGDRVPFYLEYTTTRSAIIINYPLNGPLYIYIYTPIFITIIGPLKPDGFQYFNSILLIPLSLTIITVTI